MPRRRKNNKNQGNLGELLLFGIIIFCFYCILALFDSSFTGDSGREWGQYLRSAWGGAFIVPLFFVIYLCIAKLFRFRVPRVPRQVLGTLQLYISFSFMLGFLRETGWKSDWTLFQPGGIGSGLAKFFVLNIGTFITLLLVIASFILSAYLFGSKILKISLPVRNFSDSDSESENRPRPRRKPRENYNSSNDPYFEDKPENILFPQKIPAPKFKVYDDAIQFSDPMPLLSALNAKAEIESMRIPDPKLKQDDTQQPEPESDPMKAAINMFSTLITSLDEGKMSAPEKREPLKRQKKIRRPLPSINTIEESPAIKPDQVKDSNQSQHDEIANFPPPIDIYGAKQVIEFDKDLIKSSEKQGRQIISSLKNYGVNASIAKIVNGASVTQYQLELAPGVKVSRILELANDLAMSLAVTSVRIEAPIWGTHYAGVEVPALERKIIPLRNIIDSEEFINSRAKLIMPLGCKIDGEIFIQGLESMPHILIAGSSGAGKSVFINSCILGMCANCRPDELKLLMIDTRQTDFAIYENLSHLIATPIYDVKTALKALNWALHEMQERTEKFSSAKVRNLAAYNRKNEKLPRIVIIINELADLMYSAGNETESLIARLAQKAGASGIYMILATQTPSNDVITNLIKSNIPARAAFTVQTLEDSKNIIDSSGAERLTGKGDMLFRSSGYPLPIRLQAPFIEDEKISDFVEYLSNNVGFPDLLKF